MAAPSATIHIVQIEKARIKSGLDPNDSNLLRFADVALGFVSSMEKNTGKNKTRIVGDSASSMARTISQKLPLTRPMAVSTCLAKLALFSSIAMEGKSSRVQTIRDQ